MRQVPLSWLFACVVAYLAATKVGASETPAAAGAADPTQPSIATPATLDEILRQMTPPKPTPGVRFTQRKDPRANMWGPFKGRVLDAETGQSIPGAICVITWRRNIPNPIHPKSTFNDARAAVTDPEGNFEIRGRSPPLFLRSQIYPPHWTCTAPWYEAFDDIGWDPPDQTVVVRLHRFTPAAVSLSRSGSVVISMIPDETRKNLEAEVNKRRAEMGLRPVALAFGVLEQRPQQ